MNGHRRIIRLEVHIKDDSTAQLLERVQELEQQLSAARSQLGDINVRAAIDIRDLRDVQKQLKRLGGSPALISRLSDIISRF